MQELYDQHAGWIRHLTDAHAILRIEARFALPVRNRLRHWLGKYIWLICADHRYWYQQTTYAC